VVGWGGSFEQIHQDIVHREAKTNTPELPVARTTCFARQEAHPLSMHSATLRSNPRLFASRVSAWGARIAVGTLVLIGSFAIMTTLAIAAEPVTVAASSPTSSEAAIAMKLGASMSEFVEGLDKSQRKSALYAFDDDERFDLRLAPQGLEGLRIDEMSDAQWQSLHRALGGVLSPEGLEKTDVIRSLEAEVAELEGGLIGFFMRRIRDSRRYFLAVFGEPGSETLWGMRFDGHHLSLNWTAVPGAPLSATPLFFGGQPREVPDGLERAGLRVLAGEEDRAVELITSLSADQRTRARIPFEYGGVIARPIFVGADPDLELEAAAGLSRAELDGAQRDHLDRLIDVHLANFAAPIADRYRALLDAEAASLRFAYAVHEDQADRAPVVGDPLYYRIQSAGFLIEFDDTPEDASHIHVVIRSIDGDFGRDRLAEHYDAVAH
jgi:hypothetical protein